MIPWFIWIIVICTPISILSRIFYDRIEKKRIRDWNKECEGHSLNLDRKTLPKGFEQRIRNEVEHE